MLIAGALTLGEMTAALTMERVGGKFKVRRST
jgi:hypothetical protein